MKDCQNDSSSSFANEINGDITNSTVYQSNVYLSSSDRFVIPKELRKEADVFVDRFDERKKLDDILYQKGSCIVVFTGMPGIGKTYCMLKWANEHKEEYTDGQVYVDFGEYRRKGASSVYDVLRGCLMSLGVTDARELPDGELGNKFRTVTNGLNILIALDDVYDLSEIEAFVPNSSRSTVLATSHYRFFHDLGSLGLSSIPMKPLDVESARLLLENILLGSEEGMESICQTPEDEEGLYKILMACDGVPLAIAACGGALLANPFLTLAGLADKVSASSSRMLSPDSRFAQTLWTFLDESCHALSSKDREVYHLLGMLPFSSCDASVLIEAFGECDLDIESALLRLHEWHLVDIRGRGDSARVAIHALVKAYASEQLRGSISDYEFCAYMLRYYRLLCQELDYSLGPDRLRIYKRCPANPSLQRRVERDRPFAIFERNREMIGALIAQCSEHGLFDDLWPVGEALWPFYYEGGYLQDGYELYGFCAHAAHFCDNLEAEARLISLRSRCCLLLGRQDEAASLLNEAKRISQGSDNFVLLGSLSEFSGSTSFACGRVAEALKYYEEAIGTYTAHAGEGHRGNVIAYCCIGEVYLKEGDGKHALEAYECAAKRVNSLEDTATHIKILLGCAKAKYLLGDCAKALELLKNTISICEEESLDAKLAEACSLAYEICFRLGEEAEARFYSDRACSLYDRRGHHEKAVDLQARIKEWLDQDESEIG